MIGIGYQILNIRDEGQRYSIEVLKKVNKIKTEAMKRMKGDLRGNATAENLVEAYIRVSYSRSRC